MKTLTFSAALGLLALGTASAFAAPVAGDLIAIKAGRIHTMDKAGVVENGVLLIRDGQIVGVGSNLEIPSGAEVIDYGPYADLIPGLIAADSRIAGGTAGERTADAGLFAVDSFDMFRNRASILAGGVTSAYIEPASGRLLAGIGGVVKLAGDNDGRVINQWAGLDGSIASDAYRTTGYWTPPVPATSDVGMGVEEPQMPHSLPGAIMALGDLLDIAGGADLDNDGGFGPHLASELRTAINHGATWRLTANSEVELRALANLATERKLRLVVDGAWGASAVAEELQAAGIGVIFKPRQRLGTATNWGKGADAEWPELNVPAALVKAGVPVAVAMGNNASLSGLYKTAMLVSGGLSRADALALITKNAAALVGASDRIGSLAKGKDADFVVLSGAPMTAGSMVRATWVDGEVAYMAKSSKSGKGKAHASSGPVVLEVDELFIGNGEVLRPGQILMQDGRIQEVGQQVAHPGGAMVIRGAAAMPGIIDALGHLGLQGSRRAAPPGFSMSRLMMPADATAKNVAQAGVTTIMLAPYSVSGSGTAMMAYKPAAENFDNLLLEDNAALRIAWSSRNRYAIGASVHAAIGKAVAYDKSWAEYEEAMSNWTPTAEKPKADKDEEDEDEGEESDEEDSEDKPKKKKKKGKKDKDLDALTGIWTSTEDWGALRFQFQDESSEETTDIRGSLRSDALSQSLMRFEGSFDHDKGELSATGIGAFAGLVIVAEIDDEALTGTVGFDGEEREFSAKRESKEYVVVRRPEQRKPESAPKAPKGQPKKPKLNAGLEPWRRALAGEVSVIVSVNGKDDILAAVDAFAAVSIKPVLFGADEAWKVKDQIAGRVAGILPERWPLRTGEGIETFNRFAELQQAGIPVAFYSDAEEGASDLLLMASFAVAEGMSPTGALRALTADTASMMGIGDRVGMLKAGLDADVLLLNQSPMEFGTEVKRAWVAGEEVID